MLGIYYETIVRDEYSGATVFTFAPREACDQTVDGLITCEGRIPPYRKGTPLSIEGDFQGGNYRLTEYHICKEGERECRMLLNYAAPKYKGKTTFSASELIQDGEEILVRGGLDVIDARRAIKKIISLLDADAVYKYLSELEVPYDRIADILDSDISLKEIKTDPYRYFLKKDIPITIADRIMVKEQGIHPYAPHRLIAYVRLAITYSEKSGNPCATPASIQRLVNYMLERSEMPQTHMNMALLNLCLVKMGEQIVWQDGYVYSKKAWDEETSLLYHLKRLQKPVKRYVVTEVEEIEQKLGITYTEGQRRVFRAIEENGVKILTGPPGVGKSAVIQGLIQGFTGRSRLSATTGRAAQVLSEYCNKPAETVHKMLDIRPFGETVSSKNINNPVAGDLIVVDEFSMADLELTSMLFRAIKSGSILLLVGDEDQLQSVGYGNILHDLIESGFCEVYRLTEVMRFDGEILENAKRIMQGNTELIQSGCFQVNEFSDEETLLANVFEDHEQDCQVISSIKRTSLGTFHLNAALRPKNRPVCARYGSTDYCAGDKVIFTATDYDAGYWNGDIGELVGVGKEEGSIEVKVGNRALTIRRRDLHDLSLAYAITTHKCQGSSFDAVHIILPDSAPNMLTRRLLYTAVTRARKKVTIYSVNHSMAYAITNQAERARTSILADRVKSLIHT